MHIIDSVCKGRTKNNGANTPKSNGELALFNSKQVARSFHFKSGGGFGAAT
jgi:hypothetical protein